MKIPAFLFVIILIVLSSCKKENTKPFVNVTPDDITIEAFTNQKLVFYINVYSDEKLQKLIITKKFPGESEITLKDSTLTVKNFSYDWAFYTPEEVSEDLYIYFNAIDIEGEQTKVGRKISFIGSKLTETIGVKMYSFNNNGQSAINLLSASTTTLTAEPETKDLQELQDNSSDEDLTKHLTSPSGCTFVKFNDFDYTNASTLSVKSAFKSGVQLNEISGFEEGDIYLVKINRVQPEEKYVVIKITAISDKEGIADDFYTFSIKK